MCLIKSLSSQWQHSQQMNRFGLCSLSGFIPQAYSSGNGNSPPQIVHTSPLGVMYGPSQKAANSLETSIRSLPWSWISLSFCLGIYGLIVS